jgi:hypothetical protein
LQNSSESGGSVSSWSEEEDCNEVREDEIEVSKEITYRHTNNVPPPEKTSNLKWNNTVIFHISNYT